MNMQSPEQVFAAAAFSDPHHPDVEILDAYEKVRAFRSWSYSFDDLPDDVRPDQQIQDGDDASIHAEKRVLDNWAASPSGVAAQLSLVVTFDCARWVDRGLMEQGLRALYQSKDKLDGRDQAILTAAYELIHIEWQHALATWKAAYSANERFRSLKSLVDGEFYRRREAGDAHESDGEETAHALADRLDAQFCDDDCRALDRLIRTLAPDWDAYRTKAEIAIEQLQCADAAPWLLRDVNFLSGQITVPEEDAR